MLSARSSNDPHSRGSTTLLSPRSWATCTASPTGECPLPESSASSRPPPHPCSPRWPATPPDQRPPEQHSCCWWSGCCSTCASAHPSTADSPRPPTPTKLPPTPAPCNGTGTASSTPEPSYRASPSSP